MKASKMKIKIALILGLSLSLVNCGTIKPDSPEIQISQIELPEQSPSDIEIPVSINLKPYFEEAEKGVPKTFKGKEQTCEGVSYSYHFERGPIRFEGNGQDLSFNVNGKYSLLLNYCPQCTELFSNKGNCVIPRIHTSCGVDEPMRAMNVSFTTDINLGSNYMLKSSTNLNSVKAISPCVVTVFNYNATETLEEEVSIALKEVEKDIDKEISSINLKPEMQEVWEELNTSLDLEGYGQIYFRPKDVGVSDIIFVGDSAYFHVFLSAKPVITFDSLITSKKSLPELTEFKSLKGFDVQTDVYANYDSLNYLLNSNLKGTKIDVKGREVIFDHIEVHGALNKQLSIRVDFSGNKKGTLYLNGTPNFNAERQHISFPDLDFDVETKNALLKSAKWLFDKKITKTIRNASSIDLAPYLDSLKGSLNGTLNGEITEGVMMKGAFDSISIESILPTEKELFIRIKTLGNLSIHL